jgi:IS5 family transposase
MARAVVSRPDVAAWLERACTDAEARGLAALVPLLQGLARSTAALRDADPDLTGAASVTPDDTDPAR